MSRLLFILIFLVSGCQSTASYQKNKTVTTSESQMEARSAIESVAGAVSTTTARVKYCPVCGRRFSPQVSVCPFDGAQLKEVEP